MIFSENIAVVVRFFYTKRLYCYVYSMLYIHPWTHVTNNPISNTPFTQGLRPFCLHCATTKLVRSPSKAERRQNGCLGRSMVVHRTFRHRNGRHGCREVLSMFKTVAQRSPRRSVAHRSLEGGRRKAHTSPWWQNGCTVVGHWSPRKKIRTVVNIVYQFEQRFCLPCTTIVPPLADR